MPHFQYDQNDQPNNNIYGLVIINRIGLPGTVYQLTVSLDTIVPREHEAHSSGDKWVSWSNFKSRSLPEIERWHNGTSPADDAAADNE